MTKLAPLGSIEHGIRRVLEMLGEERVESAIQESLGIERSASLIRKCGDPDEDRHQIQMRYAIALDQACLAATGRTPLLEAYRAMLDSPLTLDRNASVKEDILQDVLTLQGALGDLSHKVRDAFSMDSLASDRLTGVERHAIYAAVETLQENAEHLKRILISNQQGLTAQNADDGAEGSR